MTEDEWRQLPFLERVSALDSGLVRITPQQTPFLERGAYMQTTTPEDEKPLDVTWGQAILNMIALYDRKRITKDQLSDGLWVLIRDAQNTERELAAQTAENMGSYVIAEAIRKDE
jgi:hypothetical protein